MGESGDFNQCGEPKNMQLLSNIMDEQNSLMSSCDRSQKDQDMLLEKLLMENQSHLNKHGKGSVDLNQYFKQD